LLIENTLAMGRFRRHLNRFAEQQEKHLDFMRKFQEANRAKQKKARSKAKKRLEQLQQEAEAKAKEVEKDEGNKEKAKEHKRAQRKIRTAEKKLEATMWVELSSSEMDVPPEYETPVTKLIPDSTNGHQADTRDKEEEYQRCYAILASIHDNTLPEFERIDNGILQELTAYQIWTLFDQFYDSKDRRVFIEQALERVKSEKPAEIEPEDKAKQEGILIPKPPEILQKVLWVLKYGGKHWWLISLTVLILFFLYILTSLNLFSRGHQNIHPEAKTSGDSSPAIITSGPNSPVMVHYAISQPNNVYRPLSAEIKEGLIKDLRQMRNNFDIRISVTSDKGISSRHRVAEELVKILIDAGFEANLTQPIIRFSNDTSDVVIKYNENDTEIVENIFKVLNKFFKDTSFLAQKKIDLQRYELQIIIAGDPLFSSSGVVTFQ